VGTVANRVRVCRREPYFSRPSQPLRLSGDIAAPPSAGPAAHRTHALLWFDGMVTFGCILVGSLFYSQVLPCHSLWAYHTYREVDHEKSVLDCRPCPFRSTG